jgi:prepilin-type N-terminal cleavage/methylation domain-containing protein
MKRLNKKGFTLIELLAVIVVLAILLVIAVPRVLDVIESARSESLGKSAQIVAKHLKQEHAIALTQGTAPSASITDPTACPEASGFNASEGNCVYTLDLTGGEPEFVVTIQGLQRFAGWYAQSTDGNNATVSSTVIAPFPLP